MLHVGWQVWSQFEKVSGGRAVVCQQCGQQQRFMSNTTNMIRHLARCPGHPNTAVPAPAAQQTRKVAARSRVWRSEIYTSPRIICETFLFLQASL